MRFYSLSVCAMWCVSTALATSVMSKTVPPIIDISALLSETDSNWEETASAIDFAFREYGVFIATGHNISSELMIESQKAMADLFQLPQPDKDVVSLKRTKAFGRGYLGFGEESGLSEYIEPKEGYSFGFPDGELNGGEQLSHQRNMLQSPNHWPKGLPSNTRPSLDQMYLHKVIVAKAILRGLSRYFDKYSDYPKNYLNDVTSTGETISLMRLFHYFNVQSDIVQNKLKISKQKRQAAAAAAVESASETSTSVPEVKIIGSSPHTDWGLLTLITQDSTVERALQFRYRNTWADLPMVEHGVIVNGGDYLSLITNNRYHSPIHRVLSPGSEESTRDTSSSTTSTPTSTSTSTSANGDSVTPTPTAKYDERYSMVFFYYPNYDSTITRNSEYTFHSSPDGTAVETTATLADVDTCMNVDGSTDVGGKTCSEPASAASVSSADATTSDGDDINYNTLVFTSDVKTGSNTIAATTKGTAATPNADGGTADADSTVDKANPVGTSSTKRYEDVDATVGGGDGSKRGAVLFGDYIIKKWQDVNRSSDDDEVDKHEKASVDEKKE